MNMQVFQTFLTSKDNVGLPWCEEGGIDNETKSISYTLSLLNQYGYTYIYIYIYTHFFLRIIFISDTLLMFMLYTDFWQSTVSRKWMESPPLTPHSGGELPMDMYSKKDTLSFSLVLHFTINHIYVCVYIMSI